MKKYKIVADTPEEVMHQIKLWIKACADQAEEDGKTSATILAPVYQSQLQVLEDTYIESKNVNVNNATKPVS